MPGLRTPRRGDVYIADPDPTVGREQSGERRWLVISPIELNYRTGVAVTVAITTGGHGPEAGGLTVPVRGRTTNGVAIIFQIRAFDLKARDGQGLANFVEQLPDDQVDAVIEKVLSVIDPA